MSTMDGLISTIFGNISPKKSEAEEVSMEYYHIQMNSALEKRKYEEEQRKKYGIKKEKRCTFDFE